MTIVAKHRKLSIAEAFLATVEMRPHFILESEINALRRRWTTRHITHDQIVAERDLIEANGPFTITEGQTKKGKDWWRSKLFTDSGKRRKDDFTKTLGDYEWGVLSNIQGFELSGWFEDVNNYGQLRNMAPIYKVLGEDGQWVKYISRAWQSGRIEFV